MEPAPLLHLDLPALAPHTIPPPTTFAPASKHSSSHSMFSALTTFLRAPFKRSLFSRTRSDSCEVEKQIFSELAAAAAKAEMVATRSQEPAPVVPLGELPSNGVTQAETTKKRRLSEVQPDLPDERVSKRRPEIRAKTPQSWNNGGHRGLIPIVSPSINNTNIPKDGIEVRVVSGGKSRSLLSKSAAKTDGTDHGHSGQRENRHVATKSPDSAVSQKTADKFSYPASPIKLPEEPDSKYLAPSSIKAKHKRFGSEEIQEDDPLSLEDDIAISDKIVPPVKVQVDFESEDEEPETITTSKGLSEARSTANEAARVAGKYVIALKTYFYLIDQYLTCSRQRMLEKQKRRDRDAKLKLQAELARPSKRKLKGSTAETDNLLSPSTLMGSASDPNADSEARSKASKKFRLPLLLPEEILSTEPMIRPLTPPPETISRDRRLVQKRRRLDIDSKPPKDVQHGTLIIRVLDSGPGKLPPKASKESRMLREAWLTGQRGPKGGIERRKSGGGFVRKV
ncbi:MAG: hypothetical protein Q9195_001257 [Heterodermia aff. obscurata]